MAALAYPPHLSAVTPVLQGLTTGRAHHANLWTGPDGVGKFLWARDMARVALCLEGITRLDAPCRCVSCHAWSHSEAHPDLVILGPDPAELKIEPVRQLMAKCALKPMVSRRRVVIVRDAHAMTPQAQNAFLKTLEEPPGQTLFFLLTHQDRRLLRTIRSRCQHVRFAPLDAHSLETLHRDALAALPQEAVPGLLAACAGSSAMLARVLAAAAGDERLQKPAGDLFRAPLRERLAAVDALAESQETTALAAARVAEQLGRWARAGSSEQRRRALQLFAGLEELVARAEGNGNRKLLWERWLLQG